MSRRRVAREPESIADLFGDVIQERPSFLYDVDPTEPEAPPAVAPPAPDPDPEPEPPQTGLLRRGELPQTPPRLSRDMPLPVERRAANAVWRDDRGLLSGVVISHGLITALTVGIWRFWLKSEQRNILWSHTELEKEPLEWTGKGSEMFLGAMVALVALAITLGAAQMAASFAGLSLGAEDPQVAAAVQWGVIGLVALPLLWTYAVFRARRYRLSRTKWKGVRFGMEGSGLGLVARLALWGPVIVATAGLAWPFWRWSREAFLTRRMRYGDAAFRFEGSPWPLFLHWLPLWGAAAAAVAVAALPQLRALMGPFAPEAILAEGPLTVAAAGLTLGLGAWLLWFNWRAAEIRLGWRARRLLGVRASCDFSTWHLVDATMQVTKRNLWPGIAVYVLIAVATAIPAASAMGAELRDPTAGGLLDGLDAGLFEGFRTWRAQGLLIMSLAINYVLSVVFFLWLWMAIHAGRMHRHVVESLRFEGLETLDDVVQRDRDKGFEAEGLADALDIDV